MPVNRVEATDTPGPGLTEAQWRAIPDRLRGQAQARGFTPETVDRFGWATDPFGNLYVTEYQVTARESDPLRG